ncbi:hypothetical protein GCM10010517_62610 [Streptosporangium fragile]|uniref:Uncharacterized protein n=1 Tax=Streptosporangium fragile TaxID=46186 RepID=A0ABN3W837_9ACTN
MAHPELLARHRRVMPSWLSLYYDEPIELVRGSGRRVVDGEGKEYLDFFGGLLGNVLRITPPMTVTEEEADEALALLREALSMVDETVRNEGENR